NGLNLKQVSMSELKAAFKERGGADAQVGEKAIRFLVSGLKEAGVEISPFVSGSRSGVAARRVTRKPKVASARNGGEEIDIEDQQPHVAGVTRWPIPIPGKANALIMVPNDIDLDDWSMID